RAAQEAFAVRSHARAAAAQADGKLSDEIVPITGKAGEVAEDGCIRADTTVEALAALKPAFDANGSVTAGPAPPLARGGGGGVGMGRRRCWCAARTSPAARD